MAIYTGEIMNIKKSFLTLAVSVSGLLAYGTAVAQIPVTDAASIASRAQEAAAQITKWVEQANQMQQQIAQAKAQYDSITGIRGMGDLLNNDLVRQQLPEGFTDTYNNLANLGSGGASAGARSIYSEIKKFGCDQQFRDSTSIRDCEAKALLTPSSTDFVNQALESSQQRVNELKKLITKVDQAPDLKAASDLQNRIQAEQTLLQNEQTMMTLALKQQEYQAKLLSQGQAEADRKAFLTNTENPFNQIK